MSIAGAWVGVIARWAAEGGGAEPPRALTILRAWRSTGRWCGARLCPWSGLLSRCPTVSAADATVCDLPGHPLLPRSTSLTFMMVYVWSRRNKYVNMNFMGLFNFTAPYLPWVLLVFSIMLGHSPKVDLLGLLVGGSESLLCPYPEGRDLGRIDAGPQLKDSPAAGHLYYYLADVYPRIFPQRPRPLRTPQVLKWMFGQGLGPSVAGLRVETAPGARVVGAQ